MKIDTLSAILMTASAGFLTVAWIGGAPGGQAFMAWLAAWYAWVAARRA